MCNNDTTEGSHIGVVSANVKTPKVNTFPWEILRNYYYPSFVKGEVAESLPDTQIIILISEFVKFDDDGESIVILWRDVLSSWHWLFLALRYTALTKSLGLWLFEERIIATKRLESDDTNFNFYSIFFFSKNI